MKNHIHSVILQELQSELQVNKDLFSIGRLI